MFLRTVKAAGGQGVQHEYVRLVEAYREDGRTKQRVVCNLGRKDLLAAHLDALVRLLRGERAGPAPLRAGEVRAAGAWDWGPMLVARTLWRELGLETILDGHGGRGPSDGRALADRALVLVANRLCAPTSEHGLARWLETDFVCDRAGRRWLPAWRPEAERRASPLPRVRVELRQLKQWYRTLDQLAARKADIERELYLRLRDLFSLQVDLALYDLTSTYFEGQGPPILGAHGHSRDGKPRNRQVLVGVVMVDGWPITHHVFRGNGRDAMTVPQVLMDLAQRFGLRRIVFVGDRGMVTSANVDLLRARRQGYVVGLNRRRRGDVYRYIARATGPWLDCPVGITAREKSHHRRRTCKKSRVIARACASSSWRVRSGSPTSARSASRRWPASAGSWRRSSGASRTGASSNPPRSARRPLASSGAHTAPATTTERTRPAASASSSTRSISHASRRTKASMSSRRRSRSSPRSTR
jgi:hypothetical protein